MSLFDHAMLIVLAAEGRKVTIQKATDHWKFGLVDADGKELTEVESTMFEGGLVALHDAGSKALFNKRHPIKKAHRAFAAKALKPELYGSARL